MPCEMLPGIMHLTVLRQVVQGAIQFENWSLGLRYLRIDDSFLRSHVNPVRQLLLRG